MKQMTLRVMIFLYFIISSCPGCTDNKYKECNLSTIHENFRGVFWGDNFSNLSERFSLVRTTFGGNDKEPGYQVAGGMALDIGGIPVDIYFQFFDNKLTVIHIRGNSEAKEQLIKTFHTIYGNPTDTPEDDLAVWKDSTSIIILQKELKDKDCLFSMTNIKNYKHLTGRKGRSY